MTLSLSHRLSQPCFGPQERYVSIHASLRVASDLENENAQACPSSMIYLILISDVGLAVDCMDPVYIFLYLW